MKAAKKEERSVAPERPDIEITAEVKAKELRFDEVPETEVHPPARTERKNLPEKVRPEHEGITFRDIGVRLRIANELTVNEPDEWEESREGTEGSHVQRESSYPIQGTEKRKPSRRES